MTTPEPVSKYYRVWPQDRVVKHSGLISPASATYAHGLSYCGWDMNCCGIASIAGFLNLFPPLTDFSSTADLVATLYRECYNAGYIIYTLAENQLGDVLHVALKQIGSTQIAEFPNLFHSPQRLSIWLVNIRDAVGMYCDKYGEPYTEPAKEPWKPGVHKMTSEYQYLPKKVVTP